MTRVRFAEEFRDEAVTPTDEDKEKIELAEVTRENLRLRAELARP
jgi:hypothetical protein